MVSWASIKGELAEVLHDVSESTDSRKVRDELSELRRLVLDRRDAHIALVGDAEVPLSQVLDALGLGRVFDDIRQRLGAGRWYEYAVEDETLHIADLRGVSELRALEYHPADAIVAVVASGATDVEDIVRAFDQAREATDDAHGVYPPGLVALFRQEDQRATADFKTLQAVKDEFQRQGFSRDWVNIECVARLEQTASTLMMPLMRELPIEVQYSLAQVSDDLDAKRAVAFELTRLASALNAAVASVPIPVGSSLPITSIQIAMVAGIASLSGRPLGLLSVAEFAAAVGINLGAAVAFRELARALVSWIPVAGPAISASIAAGATLTLGRAATTHYLSR